MLLHLLPAGTDRRHRTRDRGAHPVPPGPQPRHQEGDHRTDLQVGDCSNDPKPGGAKNALGIVDVVPCAQEHRWEIYQLAPIPGTSWPGYSDVEDRTYESCRAAFTRLTADNNDGLSLSTYSYAPTKDEWNAGDHYATCIAGNVFPSTGSISD